VDGSLFKATTVIMWMSGDGWLPRLFQLITLSLFPVITKSI